MKLEWHNKKRKIDDLIPTENNPRQMTLKQKQDLQKSLEKFNLVEVPAINTDNRIISGHQRLKILQLLGRGQEKIDVRMPNRTLTEEEHQEYLLRANKNLGEWDYDLLANFDEDLLKDVGFTEQELLQETKDLFEEPEVTFTQELLEAHNYIVLYFDNEIDWLNLQTIYPLKKVKALDSKKTYKRNGIGRIIKGVDFIEKITEK